MGGKAMIIRYEFHITNQYLTIFVENINYIFRIQAQMALTYAEKLTTPG